MKKRLRPPSLPLLGGLAAAAVVLAVGIPLAHAALADEPASKPEPKREPLLPDAARHLRVSPTAGDGEPGSLRRAVASAAGKAGDTIIELAPGTYVLDRCNPPAGGLSDPNAVDTGSIGTGDNNLAGDLDTGTHGAALMLSGDGSTIEQKCPHQRILQHQGSGTLILQNIVFEGGSPNEGRRRGAGGAVFSSGGADVVVVHSSFRRNTAQGPGGALYVDGSTSQLQVDSSSFSNNRSAAGGGAIATLGNVELINSTIVANSGSTNGAISATAATFQFVTVMGNTARLSNGASQIGARRLTSTASVVTGGIGALLSCDVDITVSKGWNAGGDRSCGFGRAATDHVNVSPNDLQAPSTPDGALVAAAPVNGSVLVDTVPASECRKLVAADEVGTVRPTGSGCEIGALELTPDR